MHKYTFYNTKKLVDFISLKSYNKSEVYMRKLFFILIMILIIPLMSACNHKKQALCIIVNEKKYCTYDYKDAIYNDPLIVQDLVYYYDGDYLIFEYNYSGKHYVQRVNTLVVKYWIAGR